MMVVAFNFKKRMHLAYGLATSGMGTGLTALAPLFQLARDHYGNVGFFFILASVSLHLLVFGAILFPSKMEIALKEERNKNSKSILQGIKWTLKLLQNKGVICLCMCFFSNGFGLFMIVLHRPKFITVSGFTAVQAAQALSVTGIVSVFARLLIGVFTNFKLVNVSVPFSASIGIVSLITFIYPFISATYTGHIVFATVLGLSYANCFVLITPATLQFVEMSEVSGAVGLEFMFGGVGGLVGPVCAGK